MSRISQEFYCGECKGYFIVRLNMNLNHEVEVSCPNCGHKHHRYVKDGQIFENGRGRHGGIKEVLIIPKSSYHKEPFTQKMREAKDKNGETRTYCEQRRDGVPVSDSLMFDRWIEIAQREKGNDYE